MIDDPHTGAGEFLKQLQSRLEDEVDPRAVHEWLSSHTRGYVEGPFLDEFIHERIRNFLTEQLRSPEGAVHAFLTESTKARNDGISSGTPASVDEHLFTKELGTPPPELVSLWWDGKKKPYSQSCPDFAFRAPCPYRIVFEAKLFRSGRPPAAKTELVKGIYQCFYYLGQPKSVGTEGKRGWDYDYACLVAYDASESKSLLDAWREIAGTVGKNCWEASNIFVMVLGNGRSQPPA